MAQHDYNIANQSGAAFRADLNNALLAIVSQNSGTSAPSTTFAHQFWADTTTGTLKIRNAANSAWIELMQLDGTLTMEDGTALLPGLAFRDDLNTGLFSDTADTLGISTGGVERVEFGTTATVFNDGGADVDFRIEGDTNANLFFVDAGNDRIGLGTSSPGSLLELSSAATSAAGGVTVTNTNAAGYSAVQFKNTGASGRTYTLSLGGNTSAFPGSVYLYDDTAGASRLLVDSSGRVGIGTTSPALKLHAEDSGSQIIRWARTGTGAGSLDIDANGNAVINAHTGSTGIAFHLQTTERARIDSSGRLLVGTTSDAKSSTLVLQGNSGSSTGHAIARIKRGSANPSSGTDIGSITFEDSNGGAAAAIDCLSDGTWGTNDYPGRLVFSTTADGASSPTERVRINSAGFLKASNTGSYVDSGGYFHELVSEQSALTTCLITNTNGSFSDAVTLIRTSRGQNSGFSLLKAVTTSGVDTEFNLAGDGNAYADGSWSGGGADYAEYFEWSDSNPDAEDRRGISVVLDGDKIREAVAGEEPIGVISGNPSVVGDAAWNKWNEKYLRDDFGTYVRNEDGDRQLNPAYDPDVEYIPREERPEWDCVGLMGKLRIRKGQVTGARWIKMRDISDSVEEWLVR